ncbi:uroporphyrinogen-III synthase [Halobacillus andaensis]|uniref:Uroporphyrinogen-III synthase n=1 Tax=Halobacillus andaensis TaxID=1176239 RepID=A0A917ESR4_HALAA|nr:uroporphyrinogen-III synthase [Halobacillus andaensis]MBP2002936.1 uroporphyrinogen-III synthase [Halobacillus andaensis]GGF06718.1 uroporphyrinogen-III synthase [Halobacillus andaensis]
MNPLEGKKVLVTRPSSQAGGLLQRLERAGASPLHIPLIEFQLHDSKENERILSKLHDFKWVFFTSSNGVKFFFEWLQKASETFPAACQIAVVGEKTKRAVERYQLKADFIPSEFQAEKMAEEFFRNYEEPGSILYVRGNRSRETLLNEFKNRSILFQSMTVYDTLLIKESAVICKHLNSLDAVTFTSPSTLQAFIRSVGMNRETALSKPCFCIGSTTADEAVKLGFKKVYYPAIFIVEEMVQQMIDYFSKEG